MRRDAYVVGLSALIVAVLLADVGLFDLDRLARGLENLGTFSKDTVPPDFGIVPDLVDPLVETVEMAVAGTFLGFVLSVPLGLVGARNLSPLPLVAVARLIVAVTRTIPTLVWAILFVIMVGLGPLAGTLGIAIYTVGYLGKLYAEAFEAADPEVVEAVRGVGASRAQLARFVLWPEAANSLLSQLMFMVEYNIRASSILGFVGAGGIGFYIQVYVQTLQYQRLAALLLLTLALVLLLDVLSAWVRERYLLTAR
ncbi:MAG TPA: phosphonate ABC transporter, permease protein PhnE [Dehalococcoidia bacterium]|nr:phosphonate ABC transporter, permease protein PhnE [Dehalococcoidia bacterium]